jgi:hypothetical protein
MAAAPGIMFNVTSPNKLVGIFYDPVSQLPFFFYGNAVPAFPTFLATVGVVYKKGDLKGFHSFQGRWGTLQFSLTFDNDPKVEGVIAPPLDADQSGSVLGAGSWRGAS